MLDRTARAAEQLSRLIAFVGVIGLVALAGLTMLDVLSRWLANAPIDGVGEVSKLLIAVVVGSFFPIALIERQHVTIDIIDKVVGPRGRLALRIFADVVTLVFFAAVAWRFFLYTAELAKSRETTWLLGWPVAPWWSVVTVCLLVCVPIQLIMLCRAVRNRSPSDEARSEEKSLS